jgi:hypothetical protein
MPDSIYELLDQLAPALEALFRCHQVPSEHVEQILDRVARTHARKAKDVENPEVWLLALVEAQVRRWERER